MSRGKRKALAVRELNLLAVYEYYFLHYVMFFWLKQTQVAIQDEEDDIDEDVAPLKRRSRPKRERVCENNTSLSLGSPSSRKPNQEDRKVCLLTSLLF